MSQIYFYKNTKKLIVYIKCIAVSLSYSSSRGKAICFRNYYVKEATIIKLTYARETPKKRSCYGIIRSSFYCVIIRWSLEIVLNWFVKQQFFSNIKNVKRLQICGDRRFRVAAEWEPPRVKPRSRSLLPPCYHWRQRPELLRTGIEARREEEEEDSDRLP